MKKSIDCKLSEVLTFILGLDLGHWIKHTNDNDEVWYEIDDLSIRFDPALSRANLIIGGPNGVEINRTCPYPNGKLLATICEKVVKYHNDLEDNRIKKVLDDTLILLRQKFNKRDA